MRAWKRTPRGMSSLIRSRRRLAVSDRQWLRRAEMLGYGWNSVTRLRQTVSVHVHANACSLRNVVACSMASWASIICLCIGRRPRQIPRKPRGTHPFPCALSRSMDWQGPGRAGVSPAGARWGRKRLGFAGRDAGFPGAPWPTHRPAEITRTCRVPCRLIRRQVPVSGLWNLGVPLITFFLLLFCCVALYRVLLFSSC